MPRTGKSYPVDKTWRDRLGLRLEELKKTPAWLHRESGCPKSMISELMSGKRDSTTYLPEIHKALGWLPPMGPLLSVDDEEVFKLMRGLDSEQRAALIERGLTMQEQKRKR